MPQIIRKLKKKTKGRKRKKKKKSLRKHHSPITTNLRLKSPNKHP